MHEATRHGRVELIHLLADAGADVNLRAGYNKTPLHTAAMCAKAAAVQALLDRGADPNVFDDNGESPLMVASRAHDEYISVVRAFLRHGRTKVNLVWPGRKATALHHAAHYCRVPAAMALLAAGADPRAADSRGRIPVDIVDDWPSLPETCRERRLANALLQATPWMRRRGAVLACAAGVWQDWPPVAEEDGAARAVGVKSRAGTGSGSDAEEASGGAGVKRHKR